LHCLNPSFFLSANGNFDPYQRENRIDTGKTPLRYDSVEIGWYESRARQWVIGAKLEAMEAHCAGLGQCVLRILQRQSCPVYPVFTAEHACYQASVQYWWGEESEKSVLDMECSTDEEREAMLADMVTKQDLVDAFPAWAITLPHGDKLPRAELRKLLESVTDPEFRAIAADALALSKLKLKKLNQYEPEIDCEFVGWGAVLSWREDDVTIRVFDDMYNSAMEGESSDRIGELEIALNAPQTMRTWQEAMREQFTAIRLIDRLIYQLAERY
jgi:PRTRC genetic system protein F